MQKKWTSLIVSLIAVVTGAGTAQAASGTWNSTATGSTIYWTNSLNWSASPYPITNDTATFSNSGNNRTNVNVAGLTYVKYITFDSVNVSPYLIGSNVVNSQALLMPNDAEHKITTTAANSQQFTPSITLGTDRSAANYYFRNDNPGVTLTYFGDISPNTSGGSAGNKNIQVQGVGNIYFRGNIYSNASAVIIYDNNSGTVTLSGSNVINTLNVNGGPNSVIDIGAGITTFTNGGGDNIKSSYGGTINGTGTIILSISGTTDYSNNSVSDGRTLVINPRLSGGSGFELYGGTGTFGTFVLNGINDFVRDVKFNSAGTISVSKIGNKGSTTSNLGQGSIVSFAANNAVGGKLLYTGTGETTDRTIDLTYSGVIDQSGAGLLKFTAPLTASGNSKTLTLQGSTAGSGEIAGVIPAGSGTTTALAKNGTGVWSLTTTNLYAGATTVNGGTLALSGLLGSAGASTAYTIAAGGTLLLDNTAAANNTNRLRDASTITLTGGTLKFSNNGGAANYLENAGPLAVSQYNSTVATTRAAPGQTATLRFASIARTAGATVNFAGAALGTDDRNRVFIAGQADGLIGSWATVNGTNLAAYSSSQGVYASADAVFADVAARGPSSTILSNDASNVRISTDGVSGPIALGSSVTRINSLRQNTATDATVDTAGKTLQLADILIPENKAGITIGAAANDGTLTALSGGGNLGLANTASSALTVNAVIANNGSASTLTKSGSGTVTLAGTNTFSGATSVSGGPLLLASEAALQNSTLTTGGIAFDGSVASHAFTLGGLSGFFNEDLADTAATPNPVTLTVGRNNASTTYSGMLSGPGGLTKIGAGTLTLSGSNTFSGGFTISSGTVTASALAALGTKAVTNNATLNLTGPSDITYTGLSAGLAGSGTNNVTLGTGSATVYLHGDYSGFTGVWNIGIGAAAGAAKVYMNGADNPAATINVLSNGTFYCNAGTHAASLVLKGGDIGESIGQLRIEGGAVWTGPVTLAGDITTNADAFFGSNSGTGTIAGVIGDLNGPHEVAKLGGGTVVFANTNTYAGQTWIKAGTLAVPSMPSVGAVSSPLGAPAPANTPIKIGFTTTTAVLSYFGAGDTSDRVIDMAGTTGGATLDQSGTGLLKFTSDLTASGIGNKQLRLQGYTNGTGEISGAIVDGVASTNTLVKSGPGTWTLSGNNQFKGYVTVEDGILRIAHSNAFGTGVKQVRAGNNANGANPTIYLVGDEAGLVFETNITFLTSSIRAGAINNISGTNVIKGQVIMTSGDGASHIYSRAGKLIFAGNMAASLDANRELYLRGDGDGEISGVIANGITANLPVYRDQGSGTWMLSNTNAFTGLTTVSSGTLALGGANGSIIGAVTISGNAKLILVNTPLSNSTDRLSNTATVTLNGGALRYEHTGGETNYSEAAGPLAINQSGNTVYSSQADTGYTSAVTFASLARTAPATVNFIGTNLGENARNQIRFTTPPTLVNGIIGPWATVNSGSLATYGEFGVTALTSGYTDIAARGPSVVPNDSTANVRITLPGEDGPVTLATSPASSVYTLSQNTTTPSVVTTTNTLLRAAAILIGDGQESLTIGAAEGDGSLSAQAAGGDLTLANNNSNVTLTVNAPIVNNTSASALIKSGAGPVRLNGANTYSGPTLIEKGTLVFASSSTQVLAGVISGAGSLVKEGTNRLTVTGGNTYLGNTLVNSGILQVQNNTALGSDVGGTYISSGATLDVGSALGANALDLGAEAFTVSGSGTDGKGAIINSSNTSQYGYLNKVTLVGPTTFGGPQSGGRWDIRKNRAATRASLLMNDFNITKVGSNIVGITDATVVPGAGNIDIQQGSITLETSTTLGGSTANTIAVQSGAKLDLYNLANPMPWSLVLNDGSTLYGRQGSSAQNNWTGPVTVTGTAYLTVDSGYNQTVSGDVSGSGSLVKNNPGTHYMLSSNNTYSGTTIVSNGTLFAKYPGSLPGYNAGGKVTVVGGAALGVMSGDGTTGWNTDQINTLHATTTCTASNAVILVDTTLNSLQGVGNIANGNIAKTVSLTKQGTNTLALTGTNNLFTVRVNAGTLAFTSGSSNSVGPITVNGGAAGALLTVDGWTSAGTNDSQAVNIGTASGDRSMAVFSASATLGKLIVGNGNALASGSFIQNGGDLAVAPTRGSTEVLSLGNNGYGYYRLNSGSLSAGQLGITGSANANNNAVFDQFDGTVNVNGVGGWLIWGWGAGRGVYNLFSGALYSPAANEVSMAHTPLRNSYAVFNLIGANTLFDTTGYGRTDRGLRLASTTNNLASVINLNGGTLLANRIYAGTTLSPSFVNFNGGTLKANAGTGYASTFLQGLTAATVYPGGATIDTSNNTVTVNQSLLGPLGYGVSAISVRSGGAGYIGAPVVVISGGSGTGATAIATVDLNAASPTAGQVTGLTVTSPGSGYQFGETVLVSLYGGGYTTAAIANNAALGLNTTDGGLTKQGAGTLVLGGTNTYGGATTIRNGTLALANLAALPTNSALVVENGTLDLGGSTVTNGSLTLRSGSVLNGSMSSSTLTKLGADSATLSVALPSAGAIVVSGGTLELSSGKPGLYEGRLAGAFNTTSTNPMTATVLTTRYANTSFVSNASSGGVWIDNSTYIYSGYLWNQSSTNAVWSFAKSFDDSTLLKIDGLTLINNGTYNLPVVTSYTLTPGPHAIELRIGQGTGGVGPVAVSNIWTTTAMGFGYDPQARITSYSPGLSTTHQPLLDPGDGSLLTLTATPPVKTNLLSAAATVEVAQDAVLNLGGLSQTVSGLSGSGLVTNGALAVNGTIAPGGDGTIGTLTLATADAVLSGTLLVDIAADGIACDRLATSGNVNISGLSLVVANPDALNRNRSYTVLTHAGTLTGTFQSVVVPDIRWHPQYLDDGTVKLTFVNGTLLYLR